VAGSGQSGAGGSAGSGTVHWVGTWAASPYLAASDAQPPSSLANAVLRQVTHVSLGGSQIRVQFSNLSGNGPVTIMSAHVALCKATPAVDSTIDGATDEALSFSGMASVTIMQGNVAHEQVRQQVNAYSKSGKFDGYIDFDAALTDGKNPPSLQSMYAAWAQMDGLHPGPAGYQKMGDSVDLMLFTLRMNR
jgi:hypothetical protein